MMNLIALHSAVGVIAQDDGEHWNIMQARRRELLLLHHERAVTGNADDPRAREGELYTQGSRKRSTDSAELTGVNDRLRGVDVSQQVAGHAGGHQDLCS